MVKVRVGNTAHWYTNSKGQKYGIAGSGGNTYLIFRLPSFVLWDEVIRSE